jgi:hypothetical protein
MTSSLLLQDFLNAWAVYAAPALVESTQQHSDGLCNLAYLAWGGQQAPRSHVVCLLHEHAIFCPNYDDNAGSTNYSLSVTTINLCSKQQKQAELTAIEGSKSRISRNIRTFVWEADCEKQLRKITIVTLSTNTFPEKAWILSSGYGTTCTQGRHEIQLVRLSA